MFRASGISIQNNILQENSRNSDIYSVIQVLMPGTCYEYNGEQSKQ